MVQVVEFDKGGWGRIGKGFAQGISETLPKEMNRMALSRGLERFNKESQEAEAAGKPFTQSQAFAKIAPFMQDHPELARQFGEIIRSEAKGRGLTKQAQPGSEPSPFPKEQLRKEGAEPEVGLTTAKGVEAALKPAIPRSYEQIISDAGTRYNENRQLYQTPEAAIQAEMQVEQQNQNINQALQAQRQNELVMQQGIKQGLEEKKGLLNALVPGNVYNEIQNKAMNAVKPLEEGGEGLTDSQAIDKYGKEMDSVSRRYDALKTIGNISFSNDPKEVKNNLSSTQREFKKEGDLDNFYKSLQKKDAQGLSNSKASVLAYPLSDEKELNNAVKKLPEISLKEMAKEELAAGGKSLKRVEENIKEKTIKASKELASKLGKNGSPLTVGEYMQSKGYDPSIWRKYLLDNLDKLDLSDWQIRQARENVSWIPNTDDMWLFYMSGLDPLVEQ